MTALSREPVVILNARRMNARLAFTRARRQVTWIGARLRGQPGRQRTSVSESDCWRGLDHVARFYRVRRLSRNDADQDRVFHDWEMRCDGRPGLCRLQTSGGAISGMRCLLTTRFSSAPGTFHVLCRRSDGLFQARYSGSAEAYAAFRKVSERTFADTPTDSAPRGGG